MSSSILGSPAAGKPSAALNNPPTGRHPTQPYSAVHRGDIASPVAGKSSARLNDPQRSGRSGGGSASGFNTARTEAGAVAAPLTARTDVSANSASSSAPVVAGKTSAQLNAGDNRGRSHANSTGNAIVRASAIVKGCAPIPGDSSFVHFHIKRKLLPNSKENVIVPLGAPTSLTSPAPMTAASKPQQQRASSVDSARSAGNAGSKGGNVFLLIGGKSYDEPGVEPRHKRMVASPKRREQGAMKLLGRQSEMDALVKSSGSGDFSAAAAAGNNNDNGVHPSPLAAGARRAASPSPGALHTGKRINISARPTGDDSAAAALDASAEGGAAAGPLRFTRPPFWDEQTRVPKNAKYALPTRAFKVPTAACSDDVLSPLRRSVRMKNESVIGECLSGSNATSRRNSGASAAAADFARANSAPPPSTSTRSKPHLVDHNGHCTKGFDAGIGRKRCQSLQPHQYEVYAPTLANDKTSTFRIHPLIEHRGKNMIGADRKNRQNPALEFGGNFEQGKDVFEVGRPVDTQTRVRARLGFGHAAASAAPPAPAAATARASSAPSAAFRRSSTARTTSSLIEAPFDRACNPGKYDPTFESRTTCRVSREYVRPVLKKK